MASTVTTELPALQSREVDFADNQPSPERRSSVGDDEDNHSEGTISELDPMEGDVAKMQVSRALEDNVEASATTVSRGRGLGASQYHSISQLSSPSAAASTTTTATAAAFCVQPSPPPFDFSSQRLYGRGAADSVHVLRDMFHRQTRQHDHSCRNGDVDDADGSDADDDVDVDEEWATDEAEMMRDRMSCDEDEFCGSPRLSVNVSMSSVDGLSGDDEARGQNDLHAKQCSNANRSVSGNGMQSSSGSDSGSAGDDVIEAKRARMESIVTNMRPSLQLLGSDRTADNENGSGIANPTSFSGRDDDPKRRPKRKQYIPKQHDASSGVDGAVKQQQLDSGEETPTLKDRKSLLPSAEKMALEAELRGINDQLNYITRKYAYLFDDTQQIAAGYFAGDYTDVDGRSGKWHDSHWSQTFHNALSKHAPSQWKKFVTSTDGRLPSSSIHSVPKQQNDGTPVRERYGPAAQSSPIAGDTPVDVQRLAEMLKMEITERVESLVNEIIRNFIAKYGLTTAEDCSSLDTAAESNFTPASGEKSPEVAVRRADAAISGSVAFAEDLSPGRDVEDADRKPGLLSSTSAASFLSVPSLLLPTPRHPTATATVEEATPTKGARSLTDEDTPTRESLDRKIHSSSDVSLSAADQTAFEIPPRTAHHPLYSLFAPHAYYPNASRMAAAAAAAAAVAANGAYPPVPPVASSMLFPHCREPEQTEALPLVVNAPTKKKRTKVTDTRLSPRAARSILHDGGGHRHHHDGSYHGGHSHHHQHARADTSHHRMHHAVAPARVIDDARDPANDRRRSPPARSSTDSAIVSPFLQSRHPSTGLPPLPLLPASLPTSVAVPNPSLQHSDIMSAIFQFSQQRIQQQQQQMDSTQQRFAPPPPPPFVDKFDFKQLGGDTQNSASDGLHGSLPSARKGAESNGTDGYESIFHEDGLVSFHVVCLKHYHKRSHTIMISAGKLLHASSLH